MNNIISFFSLGSPLHLNGLNLDFLSEIKDFRNIYILKGIPGTGKEDFFESVLKRYTALGHSIEVLIGTDSKGIYAVIDHDDSCALVDSSIVAAADGLLFSSLEQVIDFNSIYALSPDSVTSEVRCLTESLSSELRCARRYMCAAGEVIKDISETVSPFVQRARMDALVGRIIKSELRSLPRGRASVRRRVTSGRNTLLSSLSNAGYKVYALEDDFSLSHIFLSSIVFELSSRKCIFYEVRSPYGNAFIECVTIPELCLAFVRCGGPYDKAFRKINLNRYIDPTAFKKIKGRLKFNRRLLASLTEAAHTSLEYVRKDEKSVADAMSALFVK